MKRVLKYQVHPREHFELELPAKAQILAVQSQRGEACMWALVDEEQPKETRRFRVLPTGIPIADIASLIFVGTFQFGQGELVFHLFEKVEHRTS